MTDNEAMAIIDNLADNGKSWIEVVGDNAEDNAKKIAERYGTKAYGNIVVANKDVENDFCMDEESLEATCENLRMNGISVFPDNFEF